MKTVRSKISGVKQAVNALKQTIAEGLDGEIAKYIEITLDQRLATNENADGSPRPSSSFAPQRTIARSKSAKVEPTAGPGEKAPATVREYKRHGYDIEHYLVRTGKSTELRHKVSGTRLTVDPATPKGRKILSYHIPQNRWRGEIRWFELNEQDMENINRRMSAHLKRNGY